MGLIYWDCVKCAEDLKETLRDGNYFDSISRFQNGEYQALNLEKMRNYKDLYSIRIKGKDKADRLLFTCNTENRDALILVVVENHDYQAAFRAIESQLKNGVNAKEFVEISRYDPDNSKEPSDPMKALPDCDESIYYGKYVFPLSNSQLDVVKNPTLPLIINGTAGSGKTVVAEQLLLSVDDLDYNKAYYFAPTEKLVGFMRDEVSNLSSGRDLIASSKLVVSTYEDYVKNRLPDNINLCGLKDFKLWYESNEFFPSSNNKSNNSKSSNNEARTGEQLYAELCIAAPYSRQEYISLGRNQSSLSEPERKNTFDILALYLYREGQENSFDPNLQSLGDIAEEDKGLVIVDESQSFSGNAIKHAKMLSKDEKVLFIGDSAQSMLSSVSNSPYIKSLFYDERTGKSRVEEINWNWSYRCPERVKKASASLLGVKQSITKEKQSTSMAISVSDIDLDVKESPDESTTKKGLLYFYDLKNKVESFAEKLKDKSSTDTVVIVPNNDYIQGAQDLFGTEYVVTAPEFLGMGSHNVVMYNCFEQKAALSLSYDSNAAILNEEEKIAINELFVSMTRSEHSLTICETNPSKNKPLFEKMNLSSLHEESEKDQNVDKLLEEMKISSEEEWKDKIIELIKSGSDVVARRICEGKFKDNANEVFESLEQSISGNQKALNEKEGSVNVVSSSPSNEKEGSVNVVSSSPSNERTPSGKKSKNSKNSKNSKKNKKKSSETDSTPLPEKLSQLYQAIYKSESDKVRELIQRIPIQDLMDYNTPNVGNLLHVAVASNKTREIHNDIAEILIDHIVASNDVSDDSKKSWFDKRNEKGLSPVYYSTLIGCDKIITALWNTKLDINFDIENAKGLMPAHIAAKNGHDVVIKALGEAGANLNKTTNKDGYTPAHLAAQQGHADVIKALAKAGAKLDEKTQDGFTPAHIAAQHGNANVIEALVEAGVNLDEKTQDGFTPAHIAAQHGHANVIEALAKAGAKLDEKTQYGYTPAHSAAQNGHANVIEALAKAGAKLDEKAPDGFTLAHIAAQDGHANVIEALAKAGAKLDEKTQYGFTPAHIAAQHGNANVIEALVEAGVNLDEKSQAGFTPAHVAVQHGHADVIEALAKAGVNLDEKTQDGFTPAHIAAQHGHANVIEALAKAGVNLDEKSPDGFTLAHVAVQHGHADVIEALAKAGAKLDETTQDGFTLAHLAVQHGHADVIEALAKAGANLNEKGQQGFTPAHIAAQNGHADVIEALAKAGVNLNEKDRRNFTPAQVAAQHGHADVITALGKAVNNNLNNDSAIHTIANFIVNKVRNKTEVYNLKEIVLLGLMDSCAGDEGSFLESCQINKTDITMTHVMNSNAAISSVTRSLNDLLGLNVGRDKDVTQDNLKIYHAVNSSIGIERTGVRK